MMKRPLICGTLQILLRILDIFNLWSVSTILYWMLLLNCKCMIIIGYFYRLSLYILRPYNLNLRWCLYILIFLLRVMLSLQICLFQSWAIFHWLIVYQMTIGWRWSGISSILIRTNLVWIVTICNNNAMRMILFSLDYLVTVTKSW